MSLLSLLNLPVPKSLLVAQGPAESGSAQANGVSAVARPPTMGAPQGQAAKGPGPGADAVHAEAAKMRGAVEARRKEAADALLKLQKLEPVLKQMTDAATGDKKKELMAKQAVLVKKTAAAEREIKEVIADLEAIDNPGSKREELLSIMARRGARTHIESDIEVDSPGLDPYKKSVNHDRTTTTTEYADGKATTEKVHDKQHVGVGGYNAEHSNERVVQTKDSTARTIEEKKSHVSWTGKASVDEKKVTEVELADGRKSSVEHSTAKEISAKGAEKTETHKVTNFDGSSTEKTKKQGVERGEGQVTATTSTTVTKTSKSGTAHATEKKASGGIAAKDGAIGAHGGLDGGKTVTNKKGMQAGVVAGVHANVLCKIGEPKGEPKMYEVSLTVSFEASVGGSAGAGKKEDSKASVGVEAKGSLEKSMTVTHVLGEADLADYTKALQDASKKGGKVAATHAEFAVISAGVNEGWGAARALYSGKALGKKSADSLTHTGDSITVTEKQTGSIGANVKVKAVAVGANVTESQKDSKKLTRNDKGGLDVDTESAHGRQKSLSGSVDLGAASMKLGKTVTHETSFGYSITIDPAKDPKGTVLEALAACKTQAQFEAFIKTFHDKIKLNARIKGKSDGESNETGVGVLGVNASIGTHTGVDEKTKTDARGKLIHKTVVGHAGAGGKLGSMADSEDDDATAEIDGDGEASLDMRRTINSNHGRRAVDKKLKQIADKQAAEGKKTGALASATGGGDEDSATHDVSGLTLTTADLKKLGSVACHSIPAFAGARRRWQEYDDLKAAAIAIAKANGAPGAVAEHLARFIGGDTSRRETIDLFVRGGYHSTMGHAYEFPDSLRDQEDDYKEVLVPKIVDKLNSLGNTKALAMCKRLAPICDRLIGKIGACKDFDNPATKNEMLQRLAHYKNVFAEGIRGYGGDMNAASDPKFLAEKRDTLMKQCQSFYEGQDKIKGDLYDLLDGDKYFLARERGEARAHLRRLDDLFMRWEVDYAELKGVYKQLGNPYFDMPLLRPNKAISDFYEAAANP